MLGKTRCNHVPLPVAGKIGILIENCITSSNASQNIGIETPIIEIPIITTSIIEFCLRADIIPNGIPNNIANIIPEKDNIKVFPRLFDINSLTGSLVYNESPRSPCKRMLEIQSTYCFHSG